MIEKIQQNQRFVNDLANTEPGNFETTLYGSTCFYTQFLRSKIKTGIKLL